jgi:tetratricopeptide (TPR) repeat protein
MRAARSANDPRDVLAQKEIEALIALDAGRSGEALRLLEDAAALEETLPFEFGPPASLKPPHELLGEVKLRLGDHAGARAAFRRALEFTPERGPSLRGLEDAAAALNDPATARDARRRLSWNAARPAQGDVS